MSLLSSNGIVVLVTFETYHRIGSTQTRQRVKQNEKETGKRSEKDRKPCSCYLSVLDILLTLCIAM